MNDLKPYYFATTIYKTDAVFVMKFVDNKWRRYLISDDFLNGAYMGYIDGTREEVIRYCKDYYKARPYNEFVYTKSVRKIYLND